MLIKYVFYGLLGMLIEVLWTGFHSFMNGDLSLTGKTYIWMFFIYGLASYFHPVYIKIRRYHFLIRGVIWALLIFIIEFLTGFILKKTIGACPWDYTKNTSYTIYGFIRFDYFPAWFVLGLTFETIDKQIDWVLWKIEQ